ncbi:hypothetical protein PG985_008528 [Apiospora marii]|uniref:uncharacterized protein n=1 Tax=Apiospora marii TaxID=335849 RepID=UPI00312E3D15
MDRSTIVDEWEIPSPSLCEKARLRREQMLGIAATVKGWRGDQVEIAASELHVCRFLWELHHRGPIPEDHFCWLVDQRIYRWIEWRPSNGNIVKKAAEILGTAPSTLMKDPTDLSSPVWARYEAIMVERTRAPDHTDKTIGFDTGDEEEQPPAASEDGQKLSISREESN